MGHSSEPTAPLDFRVVESGQLSPAVRRALRRLLDDAFAGEFSDHDWDHALGGWHVIAGQDDQAIGHASVVARPILVGAREFRAGYVEAVAVSPRRQGAGVGTALMCRLADVVRSRFELGVLSTGEWHFYDRLGWQRWQGPSYVRVGGGGPLVRSADEDDGVMVLRFGPSLEVDLALPIACDQRAGDSW